MNDLTGILYIVATPIGNLQDITQRALETFSRVDLIAAEDTRHSGLLLSHYGIKKPFFALHDHNEQEKAHVLVEKLKQGTNIALISDAGTPRQSDLPLRSAGPGPAHPGGVAAARILNLPGRLFPHLQR